MPPVRLRWSGRPGAAPKAREGKREEGAAAAAQAFGGQTRQGARVKAGERLSKCRAGVEA